MQKLRLVVTGRYFWVLVGGIFAISRLATWLFPFDSDHWIFYYMGHRWIHGSLLYVDMWDNKSPLIYGINGFMSLVFGNSIVLHRIFLTAVALLGIWLFYKTAQQLFALINLSNTRIAVRGSTILYAFLANLSIFTNSGNDNENFGVVFLLASLYFYLIYRKNNTLQWALLLSGLFGGVVFLLKVNFSVLLLPIIVDLILAKKGNIHRLIGSLAMFAFGPLLLLLKLALYFNYLGTFKQFLLAAFTFNSKYIRALGWDLHAPGMVVFLGILGLLVLFFAPFLTIALLDLRTKNQHSNYLIKLMAISTLIFMAMAGTFYSHYYLIIIPYLCLVAGATAHKLLTYKYHLILSFGLALIATLLFFASLKQLYNTFYGTIAQDARSQSEAAKYVRGHTSKNDTIFANVYGATFYRLADRNSGTRFENASHLLIDYKYHFGYGFNTLFIFDMEGSRAKYVVESNNTNDLYRKQNPVVEKYIEHNYQLETTISGYDILRRNKDVE